MKSLKTFVGTVVLVFAVLIAAGLAVMYSGVYDVAATTEDPVWFRWIVHTTMERSVESRASDLKPLKDVSLTDPAVIRQGFSHYDEMCVMCHGAPGVKPGEVHYGMNPKPPDLEESAQEMSSGELFWVVKHGVKMTGMPAWGPTHSDEKLWAIVAFVRALPGTTSEDYAKMRERAQLSGGSAEDH